MKNLLILIALCLSVGAYAQSNKEDIDLIQSLYGKEKKALVADFIQLEGEKKDAFWKIYDEYETKRKQLGQRRVALLEQYASTYDKMDDAATSKIISETADLGAKTDKLIATYHKKIEKEVGIKPAAQFFQLEWYLLSAIRLKIFENTPFVGELK